MFLNRPFAYSRIDSKIMPFYISYFPYDGQNGPRSRKSNGKDNKMVPGLGRAMERTTKWSPV